VAKKLKYAYTVVIQQHYGQGYEWEDVSEYEADSRGNTKDKDLIKHDLKEYRLTGYTTRTIFRKTKQTSQ